MVQGGGYRRAVSGALRLYKSAVSPWLPRSCRFLPTCSEYAAAVLVSHGPVQGGWLAMRWRNVAAIPGTSCAQPSR